MKLTLLLVLHPFIMEFCRLDHGVLSTGTSLMFQCEFYISIQSGEFAKVWRKFG